MWYMTEKAPIFEDIYRDYLERISRVDLAGRAVMLGGRFEGGAVELPFFNRPYRVSPEGVFDPKSRRPSHTVSVTLCQYLLLCPDEPPQGEEWRAYRDFKDAAPFVSGFLNTAEKPIARHYGGRVGDLERAVLDLGGYTPDIEMSYHLSLRIPALPRVPVWMLFNDADDEFPTHCSLLFEQRAEGYLDMESLAMIGIWLAHCLTEDVEF
jgi:hypothetical protein